MTATTEWFAVHDNLIQLAQWLNDKGHFDSPSHVIRFFEKPWKYTGEWNHLHDLGHDPGGCIVCLNDEE